MKKVKIALLLITAVVFSHFILSSVQSNNPSTSQNESSNLNTPINPPSGITFVKPTELKLLDANKYPGVDKNLNLLDEVGSGSIVYHLNNQKSLLQPALDTQVTMDISGVINRVQVKQTFTNPSNDWVEGIYVFPLPDDSAVDHMEVRIGERKITGKIKEKGEAKKAYERAKSEGKKASLVASQRPNIFTTHLANIAPGESITVALEYQQAVKLEHNRFSIRFPMVVSQRFIAGHPIHTKAGMTGRSLNTHKVKDASEVTPPVDNRVNRPVALKIHLQAGFKIDTLNSSYHPIEVEHLNQTARNITLADSMSTQANRDFVLSWQPHQTLESDVVLFSQQKGSDHYLMLMSKAPEDAIFSEKHIPREVIFIADSSGSMQGGAMKQAKKAMIQAIDRLKPSDRFNVIDFDSGFMSLFNEALPAIAINKQLGKQFTQNLKAGGGTQPLPAIEFALNSRAPHAQNYLRQIVFLTDGQVANETEILQSIKQGIHQDRFFTIGIGSAPNSFLMNKLAEFGGGTSTFIGKISEVEKQMLLLFSQLENAALTNIHIDFPEGVVVEPAKKSIPDLYAGEVITSIFKLDSLPDKIWIKGKGVSGGFTKVIPLQNTAQSQGLDVHWASQRIDGLLNQYHLSEHDARQAIKQNVIDLALKHHLVTKFTSLIAVEENPSRPLDESLMVRALANKVKAPQTATPSQIWMMLGLLLMILAIFIRLRARNE